MALDILIVDDEEDIRELIAGILQDEGYETRTAANSDEAFRQIEARRPSLVILDIWLQGSKKDGLEILRILKSRMRDLPVLMISGHGNIETAVMAIKLGAYDFIEKPFQTDKLIHQVVRATEAEQLRRENEELRKRAGLSQEITGKSAAVQHLRQSIEKIAPTNSRVLISGPPGSGKELAARQIHLRSARAMGAFVIANSAAIEPERMESELFGIEQNGTVVKTGLLEQAHKGTLLLDEVGDMPLPTQAKILRVLTDQTFTRVHGGHNVQVDVRVLSTTSHDIRALIAEKKFREDLYHRLNVVPLAVPSLAERREDIPLLAEEFMKTAAQATGRSPVKMSEDALAAMQAYNWPGNVRQLKNVVERLLILGQTGSKSIGMEQLPRDVNGSPALEEEAGQSKPLMSVPLRQAREAFERQYLTIQINRFSGNVSRTATFIGMERSALHRKLKALGISPKPRGRNGGD